MNVTRVLRKKSAETAFNLTSKTLQTREKCVQAAEGELLIDTESGGNYLDNQTVYGDFAYRK